MHGPFQFRVLTKPMENPKEAIPVFWQKFIDQHFHAKHDTESETDTDTSDEESKRRQQAIYFWPWTATAVVLVSVLVYKRWGNPVPRMLELSKGGFVRVVRLLNGTQDRFRQVLWPWHNTWFSSEAKLVS